MLLGESSSDESLATAVGLYPVFHFVAPSPVRHSGWLSDD